MEIRFWHPLLDPEFLFVGNKYLILVDLEILFATLSKKPRDGELDEWQCAGVDMRGVDGYYPIPTALNHADVLYKLGSEYGRLLTSLQAGIEIILEKGNPKIIPMANRRKVELSQKIDLLKKQIDKAYELFKLTNKKNV